ncbi:MAG: LLM class flavin-dependent oxidoreductase [Janthinobacterium lividum]
MDHDVELGLDTFGDVTAAADGTLLSHAQVIRNVVAEGVLADQVGVDVFGVGEHHRGDYAIAAPEIVLAAIAGQTRRMRLGTAVTVLSSDDPVRLYQRFATLDAASGGRAELILGRGSFTESFPLFGLPLDQYETLFEEKLALFAALRQNGATGSPTTWEGTVRAPLHAQAVYPSLDGAPLRTWIGVGGSPQSVVRAASYGLPLMLAIIGGDPARFRQYVDLHQRAYAHLNQPVQPVGVHSPGHVADTDEQARAELWPHHQRQTAKLGQERGWPPMSRADFEREADRGSIYVGAPETVARRIAATIRTLGLSRFDLKYSVSQLPHDRLMRGIELYGTRVMPLVRDMLASRPVALAS